VGETQVKVGKSDRWRQRSGFWEEEQSAEVGQGGNWACIAEAERLYATPSSR
jgi:hypothetical protein